MQELSRMERESELSSDEQHRLADSLQKAIDSAIAQIDDLVESKAKELASP